MAHNKGWRNNPTDPSGRRHGLSAKGIKNAPSKSSAIHKSMSNNYRLTKAFHPKKFEKGVYAVSFHKIGKPFTDENTELFQVKAKSRQEAINKARLKLPGQQTTRYRILIKPEGENKYQETPITFGSKQAAETFANGETAAGMGEEYDVKAERGHAIPKNIMVLPIGDKLEITNIKTGRTIRISKEGDYDRDGVMNYLDCDPTDPTQQGFFDNLKTQVQNVQQKFKTYQDERSAKKKMEQERQLASLRQRLEEKEEQLEQQKEATLLKLQSKVSEQRAAAAIKAQEQEIDKLQAQLEEGTLKQRLKLAAKSSIQRAGILLPRALKRLREGETTKKGTPRKKRTAVSLTAAETEATSPATIKQLEAARRRKAEAAAKLETQRLNQQAKQIESQLKRQPRKKKKKETFLGL